ncbi:MAG: LPS biosynthesis protein WbpP [Anaerolineaceae bacterium 4572_5.1]|nr:MAG: LPS biosynthesis protein WbpP [Anaerolineaceae bacterium 4572_5.1]RLD04685.1 MAG: LPS biosynthesis protein WbpP [Chloroflexota bacterium]
MRTCLVTGGAGFIGSAITRALLERGDNVRVLDNFSTGKRENLSSIASKIELIEGDIRDTSLVAQAVRDVDYIFHQAAFVSVPLSLEDPAKCFDVNVAGTLNVLSAAQRARVKRVVLASSAAVYGDTPHMPLTEESRLTSLSPYAAAKRTTETYADLYTRALGLDVVALRYFNVYGPRQSPASDYAAAIPIFIHRLLAGETPTIYGDGYQSRDFVFVEDVARANLLAAEAENAPGQAFNICTGEEITVIDLVEALRAIVPHSPEPKFAPERPGDIYRSVGDASLAASVLGFQPQISLAEGFAKTVNWTKSKT